MSPIYFYNEAHENGPQWQMTTFRPAGPSWAFVSDKDWIMDFCRHQSWLTEHI